MELKEVIELINAVSESKLTRFDYEDDAVTLSFEADRNEGKIVAIQTEGVIAQPTIAAPVVSSPAVTASTVAHVSDSVQVASGNVVNSPLVGIFYSAAAPGEAPFVKVGDTVKKGQVLGIVEAMKLMNEIESEFDGVVKQILVDNEQMVEYNQPMFVIE
ncbi:MAG: acetyl-CoA carboxylase biotin carboxyl carrier protein [Lachnospira sp.]|nr:acetyl-CoA carboxylase biotin carboxyl carrier protein [Lachnospira sp.]